MLANDIFQLEIATGSPIPSEAAIYLIKYFREVEGWASSKTKSAAFFITELEDIINKVKSVNGNGVRIYFGKYPTSPVPNFPLPAPHYAGRTTVVFVPTIDNGSGGFLNYFEVEKEVLKPTYPIIPAAGGGVAYNHGQLEP